MWALLCATVVVLIAVCLAASNSRADEAKISDSGWLVASPTLGPVDTPAKTSDQIALEYMLRGTILKIPDRQQAEPTPSQGKEPVYTSRRSGRGGWRNPRSGSSNYNRNSLSNKKLSPTIRDDLDYDATLRGEDEQDADSDDAITPPRAEEELDQPTKANPRIKRPTPTDDIAEKQDPPAEQQGPIEANPSHAPVDDESGEDEPDDFAADDQDSTEQEVVPDQIADSASEPAELYLEDVAQPLPTLTRAQIHLRSKIRRVLRLYFKRPLNSQDHDPWEVMHGMLAYEVHSRILRGGPMGRPITAVGWLCYNKPCKNQTVLYVDPEGELRVKVGVGLQGHEGQLLAMLAQCKVPPTYPIHVGEHEFTVAELVAAEQKTCYADTELTFKLIALMHYLDSDATWLNDQGATWDIPRLIREELKQPIRGAACGGTHRLAGLSLAVKRRIQRREPVDGEYALAAEFVKKYQHYAFRLQNRDGSLSTEWFRGPGSESDIDRRIKTTGHILEWLVYSLDHEDLDNRETVMAVNYLANLMLREYKHDWEVGPTSHAIHALSLYDERVFKPYDGPQQVANRPYWMNSTVDRSYSWGSRSSSSKWGWPRW